MNLLKKIIRWFKKKKKDKELMTYLEERKDVQDYYTTETVIDMLAGVDEEDDEWNWKNLMT